MTGRLDYDRIAPAGFSLLNGIDPASISCTGMPAGTAASILGAEYPDLYAAVRVQSGLACGSAHDVPSAFAAAMKQGGPVGWGRK